ncbi:hypothetical protein ONZ45_g5801 [Pleurotus djamor]|nr:hypothetical protein ONZ45_g5801 [Pleurotus djamor]
MSMPFVAMNGGHAYFSHREDQRAHHFDPYGQHVPVAQPVSAFNGSYAYPLTGAASAGTYYPYNASGNLDPTQVYPGHVYPLHQNQVPVAMAYGYQPPDYAYYQAHCSPSYDSSTHPRMAAQPHQSMQSIPPQHAQRFHEIPAPVPLRYAVENYAWMPPSSPSSSVTHVPSDDCHQASSPPLPENETSFNSVSVSMPEPSTSLSASAYDPPFPLNGSSESVPNNAPGSRIARPISPDSLALLMDPVLMSWCL